MIKKGFTLIELLAVIIILAIVALIATPIILNVIDDARISAGKSEANMILSGINNYCASEEMKYQLDNSYTKICTKDMTKEDVPTMVNLGNATVEKLAYNGTKLTELVIKSNTHTFTLCASGTFVMDDEACNGEIGGEDSQPEEQGTSLISTLLGQYQEGNTTGLVKDATNPNLYYYTGTNEEVANNFLWYGGHQWRVLEFDTEAKTLTLITQQPLTAIQPASTVWTTKEEYESSYINSWLNDYFWNSLDSSVQNNILDSTFNVGIYTDIDEITTIQKVGLLDEDQYVRAGSSDCFLDIKDYFWIGNRFDLSYVRHVDYYGNITGLKLEYGYNYGVRAVIKIFDTTIMEGNGTLYDNYRKVKQLTSTDEVQAGEYINLSYNGDDGICGDDNICTFRVVSKDNDNIKLVLNGTIGSSGYGNSAVISPNSLLYSKLNKFKNNLNGDYLTKGNFGYGPYGKYQNYTDVYLDVINEYIGLPTVGDLFSGNDIDLSKSNTKTFVDVNTIENPIINNDLWTMNRYDSSHVNFIDSSGGIFNIIYSSSLNSGIRPVIYLKLGLTFKGGEGTPNSPYVLQ